MISRKATYAALFAVALAPLPASAAMVSVPMTLITEQGAGAPIGFILLEDSDVGVKITPELAGLPPGPHGFHLHQNASCEPASKDDKPVAGLAAGGHWDPEDTGKHLGPMGAGHMGDLPVLEVAPDGTAKAPVTAPRLSVAEMQGHALVIHAGGDNYADQPAPLGGGGMRIACGVVK